MRSKHLWLLTALFTPLFSLAQFSSVNNLLQQSDAEFFQKELVKRSVILQKLYTTSAQKVNLTYEEAKELIDKKLEEINNEELNNLYAQASPEKLVQIGIALYLMMGMWGNLPSGFESEAEFGGGFGFFVMYTLASFILMPELSLTWVRLGEKGTSGGFSTVYTLTYLTLALTTMYLIDAGSLQLVVGLSPLFAYALGGKVKDDDGNKYDIQFGDNEAKRLYIAMGVLFGVMFQNSMIVRLQYNFGLTKFFHGADPRINAFALILTIPLLLNKNQAY